MPGCLSKIPDYIHFLLTKIHNFMQKAASPAHTWTTWCYNEKIVDSEL